MNGSVPRGLKQLMAYLGMSYSFNQNSLPTMDAKVFFPANRLLP